jgi:hypothetical protein
MYINIDSKSIERMCVTAAGFQMNHAGEREREEEVFFYCTAKILGIYYLDNVC